MAVKLLQSQVQRIASQTGVIAAGRERKGYSANGNLPAESTLRHPRADFMADLDRRADSMERVGTRAGRPIRPAGGAVSTTVARTATGAILSAWSPTRLTTTTTALGGRGCRKPMGAWNQPWCGPQVTRPTGANLQAA